ncbi:uncharacterized protein LOC125177707 [Hyalella azteca]|uniref:Uncharacterized protein LOC125177707 n=1 Tax=Hyalella azteca TaxID=294128 RepID=A0A979FGM7_HYAAZ|nr:uncharacterized protein LOC125177707 [Hyalella azteca]
MTLTNSFTKTSSSNNVVGIVNSSYCNNFRSHCYSDRDVFCSTDSVLHNCIHHPFNCRPELKCLQCSRKSQKTSSSSCESLASSHSSTTTSLPRTSSEAPVLPCARPRENVLLVPVEIHSKVTSRSEEHEVRSVVMNVSDRETPSSQEVFGESNTFTHSIVLRSKLKDNEYLPPKHLHRSKSEKIRKPLDEISPSSTSTYSFSSHHMLSDNITSIYISGSQKCHNNVVRCNTDGSFPSLNERIHSVLRGCQSADSFCPSLDQRTIEEITEVSPSEPDKPQGSLNTLRIEIDDVNSIVESKQQNQVKNEIVDRPKRVDTSSAPPENSTRDERLRKANFLVRNHSELSFEFLDTSKNPDRKHLSMSTSLPTHGSAGTDASKKWSGLRGIVITDENLVNRIPVFISPYTCDTPQRLVSKVQLRFSEVDAGFLSVPDTQLRRRKKRTRKSKSVERLGAREPQNMALAKRRLSRSCCELLVPDKDFSAEYERAKNDNSPTIAQIHDFRQSVIESKKLACSNICLLNKNDLDHFANSKTQQAVTQIDKSSENSNKSKSFSALANRFILDRLSFRNSLLRFHSSGDLVPSSQNKQRNLAERSRKKSNTLPNNLFKSREYGWEDTKTKHLKINLQLKKNRTKDIYSEYFKESSHRDVNFRAKGTGTIINTSFSKYVSKFFSFQKDENSTKNSSAANDAILWEINSATPFGKHTWSSTNDKTKSDNNSTNVDLKNIVIPQATFQSSLFINDLLNDQDQSISYRSSLENIRLIKPTDKAAKSTSASATSTNAAATSINNDTTSTHTPPTFTNAAATSSNPATKSTLTHTPVNSIQNLNGSEQTNNPTTNSSDSVSTPRTVTRRAKHARILESVPRFWRAGRHRVQAASVVTDNVLQQLVVAGELTCSKEDAASLACIQLRIEETCNPNNPSLNIYAPPQQPQATSSTPSTTPSTSQAAPGTLGVPGATILKKTVSSVASTSSQATCGVKVTPSTPHITTTAPPMLVTPRGSTSTLTGTVTPHFGALSPQHHPNTPACPPSPCLSSHHSIPTLPPHLQQSSSNLLQQAGSSSNLLQPAGAAFSFGAQLTGSLSSTLTNTISRRSFSAASPSSHWLHVPPSPQPRGSIQLSIPPSPDSTPPPSPGHGSIQLSIPPSPDSRRHTIVGTTDDDEASIAAVTFGWSPSKRISTAFPSTLPPS